MPQKISTETEFNETFHLYYEELCRIVLPIVKDKDIAEDVVQDVFVKMWIRKDELEIKTTVKGYLYKAVVFRALDHLRKQKNTTKVNDELKVIYPQSHNNVTDSVEEKELNIAINEGLDKMPENMRVIFQLSRFTGLKNREIAEQLDISIKTVESNMTKALKLLHEHLKPLLHSTNHKMILWLLYGYFIK
ncbi:MAG: RNA polymerase sigma-70 factor [Bacteroidetes bacterium]|nr:RNA polymerase sigma-70 factor [Bacteroidota bacterium]